MGKSKKQTVNLEDNTIVEKVDEQSEINWKSENVKISIKNDSVTKTSALMVIEDKNDSPKPWGVDFLIQKLGDNEKWVELLLNENATWVSIAMLPNENGITEMQTDWSNIYGELGNGTYRIVKYNGTNILYSETFKIH